MPAVSRHPFRFAVADAGAASGEEWREMARRAEALGYSTLHVPDHYVDGQFQPMPALMAAAAATTTLRVGGYVFDNDFRHPAHLAKEAATLDLLSDGRLELGLGAGWNHEEYAQMGIPFEEPGVRVSRMAEGLAIIKQFFTQDVVGFSGKYYNVSGLPVYPKPVQKPHPPILLGGGGKRMLGIAGREADIVSVHFHVTGASEVDPRERTQAALREKVDWLKEAAGERFDSLELNLLCGGRVVVTDDRSQAAEDLVNEGATGPGTTPADLLANPRWFIGSIEEQVQQVVRLRENFGVSYFTIAAEYMDVFAPVVARLARE